MSGAYEIPEIDPALLGLGMPADPDEEKLALRNRGREDEPVDDDSEEDDAEAKAEADAKAARAEAKAAKAAEKLEKAAKDPEEDKSEEDDEGDEDDSKKKGPKTIPYTRFKKVNDTMHAERQAKESERAEKNALAARIAELEGAQHASKSAKDAEDASFNFKTKETEYVRLINEMEFDKAAALREEIDDAKMSRRLASALAEQKLAMKAELAQLRNEQDFIRMKADVDVAAASIFKMYPELDDNHNDANSEAILEVVDIRNYLIEKKGMHPADALKEAARRVAKEFGLEQVAAKKKPVDTSMFEKRKADSEEKHKDASSRLPPPVAKVGVGSKREDTSKTYSQKQWLNLSQEDRDAQLGIKSKD